MTHPNLPQFSAGTPVSPERGSGCAAMGPGVEIPAKNRSVYTRILDCVHNFSYLCTRMKTTSVRMSDMEYGNLDRIASGLGYKNKYGEASWRIMLRALARGELVVSLAGEKKDIVIPAGPMIPAPVPAWNATVAKGEFVTEREDGYFVDTEEFDKPVPQRRGPASEPILPVASNVQIPQYSSKEEKLAALAKLGLMKGSQLT